MLTLALLWLTAWAARFSLRHGLPYLTRAQYCLWQWAQGRDTWLRRQLLALLDPTRTETKSLVLIAALLIGTLWLFTGILEDVVSGDPLVRIDATVFNFLQTLRTTWSDRIMIALTELGDGAVTLPLTVVVLLWLLVRRNWSTAAYWLGAVSFAALATLIMKITLHLPRPEAGLYSGWRAFSFPSGHTVVNTTLYGFLAFLIAHRVQPLWRNAIVVGLALVVIAIAFSRLYLGADWVSDVIGGVAFGLAWVTVMSMAYSRHDAPILPAGQLLCIVCATVVVAGAVHVSRSYLTDVTRYALHPASRTLSVAEWWRGAWRTMPTWRIDLKGEREEALTVQWAGSPNGLKQRLLATGWQVPEPWSISGVFAWLASPTLPAKLPVLPQLQEGRPATLTLIYLKTPQEVPGTRLVLRLWATGVNLRDDQVRNLPLLIGTVVEEHFSRPFSLVTLSREVPDLNMPREQLAAALGRVQVEQRVQRSTAPRWDGRVLLLHDSVPSLQPCGAPIP